jgi:hypothetical protein
MPMLTLYAVATVVMAVTSVTAPEHRIVSAAFFLLGLTATWRQYKRRRRHSLD